MKQASLLFVAVVVFVLALVAGGAFFIVNEAEQVIITQFGRPVGDPIDTPGLKFKIPFVQKVNRFEKRFLEWDGDPNQLPTKDKRFIWVNNYARWRITDPLLFFQRLRDERGAQSRLDDILDGETRNTIAKHNLIEVVRSTDGGVTWSGRYDCLVDSPHGPIQLADGRLLYAGKDLWRGERRVGVCESKDDGETWQWLATIPTREGDDHRQYPAKS